MQDTHNGIALVTGGGSGIGREICHRFYRGGYGLVVVSLVEEELVALEADLLALGTGLPVRCLTLDLTTEGAPEAVARFCDEEQVQVDVLINNAGFGLHGNHVDHPLPQLNAMLRLNTLAVSGLCHVFGQQMVQRGRGTIINIGSTSAFQALPNLAAYAASKAFVVSFTQALAAELHEQGVAVHCVCPGTTKTPFLDVAGLGDGQPFGSTAYLAHKVAMSPKAVAELTFDVMSTGDVIAVPGLTNKLHYHATHWLPKMLLQPLVNVLFNRD